MGTPKLQERPAGPDGKWTVPAVCVLLAVAVLLVFGQTLRHEFVNYDDDQYFSSNSHVQHGLTRGGVAWAFRTMLASNWHPLTWLSLMLDVELFGPGPVGPHLTNVLLHAANTVLLFLLLRRLTDALWPSAFVAAVFAIHPLHVESVAWVAERKDVLSGLFFMLALLMYARFAQCVTSGTWPAFAALPSPHGSDETSRRGKQVTRTEAAAPAPDSLRVTRLPAEALAKAGHPSLFYGLSLLFFTLGLMSKPMLVTLPFVLLLLDYWPLNRFARFTIRDLVFRLPTNRLVIEKIPFLALSAASCAVTLLAQRHVIEPMEWFPLSSRINNALVAYVTYLGQMFYPAELAVFYPLPESNLPPREVLLALILLAGIGTGVLVLRRRRPYLLVGWLWYLGVLVPVIGLVQVGGQGHADRYTYLPFIGVFIMLAWGARDLFSFWRHRRQVLGVAAFILMAALMACTVIQTRYWRNSVSLWTHALACTSRNYVGHNNLGMVLAGQGRFTEAIEHYQEALEIKPGSAEVYNNWGMVLAGQGRFTEAIEHYQKALEIKPGSAEVYNNWGAVLAEQGQPVKAIEYYRKALEIKPDYAAAHFNLGDALAKQARYSEAIEQFQQAVRLRPDSAAAHFNLGDALAKQARYTEAMEQFQQAVQLKPDYAEAHYRLGGILRSQNRLDEAVKHYQKAIELIPAYADAHGNLANVLAAQGRLDEAIPEYQRTLELVPNSAQAHFRFGQALQQQKNVEAAIEQYQQALRLDTNHEGAKQQLRALGALSSQ
jgi:tetratricopeptide (TPR) repeat protein